MDTINKKNFILQQIIHFKYNILFIIVLILLDAYVTYKYPYCLVNIVDVAIVNRDVPYFIENVILLCIFQITSLLVSLIIGYLFCKINNELIIKVKNMIIEAMFSKSNNKINEDSNKVLTIMNNDVNNIEFLISRLLSPFLLQIITVTINIFVLIKINKMILIIVFIVYPLLIVLQLYFNKIIEKYSKEKLLYMDNSNNLIKEFINSINTYITLNAKNYYLSRFNKVEKNLRENSLNFNMSLEFNNVISKMITDIAYVIVLLISGFMILNDQIRAGEFTLILLYTQRIFNPINMILIIVGRLQNVKISLKRISEILN